MLALIGIAALLMGDALHHYKYTLLHQHIAAFPLMFIGLSYICLQFCIKQSVTDTFKSVLLGLAFVLWGGEMLLPASAVVTVMDGAVVTIFVVDLAWVIKDKLTISSSQPS
jgi:hypothetical protein